MFLLSNTFLCKFWCHSIILSLFTNRITPCVKRLNRPPLACRSVALICRFHVYLNERIQFCRVSVCFFAMPKKICRTQRYENSDGDRTTQILVHLRFSFSVLRNQLRYFLKSEINNCLFNIAPVHTKTQRYESIKLVPPPRL